jgi:hypothetical protein
MKIVPEFEPWSKYPDLTEKRLSQLATEIRKVRRECAELYQPEKGDGRWSLGCRVYERTFFSIVQLASVFDWLTINPELQALRFSFAVGSVPLRFYKGDPNDPPSRYLELTEGEQSHHQYCFEFEGIPTVGTILRLAVDVDVVHEAAAVYLIEINEFKEVTGKYRIPWGPEAIGVVPMQVPPVTLPPVVVEPIADKSESEQLPEVKGNVAS